MRAFISLLSVIACCAVLINPTQARAKAKADFFSDEDDCFIDCDEEKVEEPVKKTVEHDHSNHDHDHSNHDHDAPVLHAAGPLGAPPNWNQGSGGGSQMGNFAGYNESCSPTGKSCVPQNDQKCSEETGRCICTDGFVYVRQTETCWPIIKSDQDTCSHDIQCQAGKWGQRSRCDERLAKCQCFDHETNGKREMISDENGLCYVRKSVGDLCNTHEECDKTIRGESYCKYGEYNSGSGQRFNGTCQCKETHMWWQPLKACLRLSTKLKDECKIDQQCKQGSLGQLSNCTQAGVCECFPTHHDKEVIYYGTLAKCFEKRAYNDTCTQEDECKASLGPDVKCDKTDDFPEENVCHCPKGTVCRNAGIINVASGYILALAFGVVIIALQSIC